MDRYLHRRKFAVGHEYQRMILSKSSFQMTSPQTLSVDPYLIGDLCYRKWSKIPTFKSTNLQKLNEMSLLAVVSVIHIWINSFLHEDSSAIYLPKGQGSVPFHCYSWCARFRYGFNRKQLLNSNLQTVGHSFIHRDSL